MKKIVSLLGVLTAIAITLTACGTSISRGTVSDTAYESEFLNLGFTLAEGFTFATEDEIIKQYGLSGAQDLTGPVVYDVSAGDIEGSSVAISIESVSQMDKPVTSAQEHLRNLSETMGLQLDQAGMSDIQAELTTVALAGKDTDALVIRADFGGVMLHQTYLCELRDEYLVVISIMALDEATYNTLMSNFYRPQAA